MHNSNQESALSGPVNLLKHYCFESNGQSYEKVVNSWLERFPLSWVNLALIESLHQGRYKVVSVEQILTLWQRRGKPSHHFNHDFERLVSNNLPQPFGAGSSSVRHDKRPPTRNSSQGSGSRPWNHSSGIQSLNRQNSDHSAQVTHPEQSSHHTEAPTEPENLELLWQRISTEPAFMTQLEPSSATIEDQTQPSSDPTPLSITHPVEFRMEEEQPEQIDSTHDPGANQPGTVTKESLKGDSHLPVSVPFSSSAGDNHDSIHQFVPQSASGVFHSKLTAMAQINV